MRDNNEEIKNEHRFTKVEETMKHLGEKVDGIDLKVDKGFEEVKKTLSMIELRMDRMADQQDKDSKTNDEILRKVDDHVEPDRHSKLVVEGLGRRIWGETWIRKIISVIVIAGIVVLLFPIEEVEQRINMILVFLGLK